MSSLMAPINNPGSFSAGSRGDTSGGLTVSREMRAILEQPGYLTIGKGAQKVRQLYAQESLNFDCRKLSAFGMGCFVGDPAYVKTQVDAGIAPDVGGTETPFRFGYATLIVAGAQRLSAGPSPGLKHQETLEYLISMGLPVDLEDITGLTALMHASTSLALRLDLAKTLIVAGANVNHRNRYGEVALFGAFQNNQVASIDLLLEHGADLEIPEAHGMTPMSCFLTFGPQVTSVVQKWIKRRSGKEAPRTQKQCDSCGKDDVALKNCSKCHVARYCSPECQRKSWPSHKKTCQPFSASNTVSVKPFYQTLGHVEPLQNLVRQHLDILSNPTPDSHHRAAHVPKGLSSGSKQLIIKVQVPFDALRRAPHPGQGDLLVYTKKRDFACAIRRIDNANAYDRISSVVKARGVGGAKAYFAAELRSKEELVVKVSEVLAEQPF